ncbi:MAG: anaerobic sulfatase maturase [Clostridiales bacterium]|nr:anaerobic sulfatase maturase [Clostridiales bacterium]
MAVMQDAPDPLRNKSHLRAWEADAATQASVLDGYSESTADLPRAFAAMAKPVGSRCNLQCGYCYYLASDATAQNAGFAGHTPMTDTTLERYIRQYIEGSPGPEISFVWHGGEPTLAGLDFYRQAVDTQRRFLPEGWICRNNIQTNGVLLDEEWCAFLAEADFDVGLSIDGAQWLHDRYRKDHGGHGTYERAANAVRRLQAHGVQPDLLCTVTSSAAGEPLEVYRALRNLDTGWIQFIPIVRRSPQGSLTEDSVSGEGYGQFLCVVFDEWSLHDLGKLDVQLFAETARVLDGGSPGLCWMAPTCGRVLIVEQDGGVYACDHFVAPGYRIGDLYTASLGELAAHPFQVRFGEDKRTLLPHVCHSCPWLAACNGGCPKDRFLPARDGGYPENHLCAGLQHFFAHAQPVLSQIVARTKQGQDPPAIMTVLRDEARAMWKGVGRNDLCPCGSGKKAKNCCWDRRP